MSDRYLYKAKRVDNKEWIKGYLYRISESLNPFIMLVNRNAESHEVDPSTICQYTGLHDCTKWEQLSKMEQDKFLSEWNIKENRKNQKEDWNGKKIWENDIIRLHQFLFDGSEYEKEILISIEYITEMMCFGANLIEAKEIKRYMGYKDEDTEKVVIPFNDFYGLHDESFEVIGNIFDNPSLLEGGTE